jgi:hypothetical protein
MAAFAAAASAQMSFSGPTQFPTGLRPDGIASGDFDGDGDTDMAVTVDSPDRISVYFNQGGTFGAPTNYQTGSGTGPSAIIARDLDGDTDLDLAFTLHNANQARTLMNQGNGTFTPGFTAATGSNPIDIEAGSFGGDSRVDLATCNRDGNSVTVLIANGAGYSATSVATQAEPRQIAAADFDADGDTDLFATNHDSRSISFLKNNAGVFVNAASFGVHPSTRPEGVAAGDLDGDGDVDLAVALSDDLISYIAVFANLGNGTMAAPVNFNTGGQDTDSVALADFDADGDLDAALSSNGSHTVSFMANNGSGAYGSPLVLGAGTYPEWVQVLDIDADGSLDVAVANRDSNNLSFYLNNNESGGMTAPGGFGVATGNVVGGNLSSLLASDDNRLVIQPGFTLNSGMAPVVLEVSGTSATQTATSLRFTLESSASTQSLEQRIFLFNYVSNSWVPVDARPSTLGDTTAQVVVGTNATQFIDPTTRTVRARIEWKATAAIFSYPWSTRTDLVRWNILP